MRAWYTCEICGHKVDKDDNYCWVCGHNLLRNELPWTEEVEEANNLHWLAQIQRRLVLPTDSTEKRPFLAFEYGWKVLENLHNSLSIPEIVDSTTGKKRKRNTKEKILYLFDHY